MARLVTLRTSLRVLGGYWWDAAFITDGRLSGTLTDSGPLVWSSAQTALGKPIYDLSESCVNTQMRRNLEPSDTDKRLPK